MSANPSDTLQVVLIGTPSPDPALDLQDPAAPRLLTAYERSRSVADRDALPLLPQARPCLFDLKPLSSASWRVVREAFGELHYHRAFLTTCFSFKDELGVVHRAADHGETRTEGKVSIANDEWLDFVLDRFGAAAIRELAQVAINRVEAGPRAIAPFLLPPGARLPR